MDHTLEKANKASLRLAVYICYSSGLKDLNLVRQLAFGIEEEGLPHRIVEMPELAARQLAEEASRLSSLEVGIGVDEKGCLCLHQTKLPEGFYLFETNATHQKLNIRNYGANGARLVKGMPFKDIE